MLSRLPGAALILVAGLTLIFGVASASPKANHPIATVDGNAACVFNTDNNVVVLTERGLKPRVIDLQSGGATFIEPIMKFWVSEYEKKTDSNVKINYQGKGSGAGIASMTKKEFAFGCSDAPMNKKQLEEANNKGGPVVHIPLVIGAVVPKYNLPGVAQPIKFTGPVLAEIFTGKIRKWNDAKVTALNPGVNLPDQAIQPVYRADPSGTSFIFSDYLSKVDGEFKKSVGASTNPNWPTNIGIKQPRSDGVAGHISRTPGAIGYIELTYALDTKAKFGSVQNKSGKDILANLDSISAAAAASLDKKPTDEPYSLHELTYNLTNADGDNSYPIAGISFGVVYQNLSGAHGEEKAKATVDFFRWATTEGQALARKRNFAPLPPALQEKIKARLDTITVK
jgi:phosphate transport system substrate-binding protein